MDRLSNIAEKMHRSRLARLLTSHTALALCYGVFLLLYEVKYLREVIPAVHPVLIAWAGALAVYDVAVRKLWQRLPLWQLLAAFALVGGVTALVNHRVGLGANLKIWVLVCLPLVAFLPLCLMQEREKREKALLTALSGGAVVVFLASLVALGMYLLRLSLELELFDITHMVGMRYYILDDPDSGVILYGFYTDTNHAAAYAVVFALYSLWLLDACRRGVIEGGKGLVKGFAIANLVVQSCYFPLANSRGAWLCLIVAGVMCVFLYAFCTGLKTKNTVKRAALAAACAVLAVLVLCLALVAVRSGLSVLSKLVDFRAASAPTEQLPGDTPVYWDDQGADTFTKTDDGFGAGRLVIWKEALQLFLHHPVLGIGPDNSAYYAQLYTLGERLPYGSALHNSFLDLLVDYGIVGFLLLMSFFACCAVGILRRVFAGKVTRGSYLALLSVVFLAGVSVFLSCSFINTTAMYYLMLCMLSFLLAQREAVKE